MVPILHSENFHSKYVILLGLCLVFAGGFHPFPQWFNIFAYWYFAFKVCKTPWIMPVFVIFISPFFLSSFKIKYSIKLEDDVNKIQQLFMCALLLNL